MNSRAITKIQGIIVIVIIIVAAGAAYYLLAPKEKPSITVTTWGENFLDAMTNGVGIPFEQQYGVHVNYELQASSGEMATKLIAEARAGQPSADVFLGGGQAVIRAAQAGVMIPMTESLVPNLADVTEAATTDKVNGTLYYVGVYGLASGWALRTDLIPPDLAYNGSWRWFLDSRLKGKLAVHDPTWGDQLAWGSVVYGGDDHNFDPAFRFYKDLAPNLKFVFSTDAEATAALTSGEVWGVYEYATVIKGVADKGTKVQMVYPEDVPAVHGIKSPITFDVDVIGAMKGGKEDLAFKFINYILSPEAQYAYNVALGNAPVNMKAKAMPADVAPWLLSGSQLQRAWQMDQPYYASIQDQLVETWQTEVAPLVGKG
jgi:putative spermidine/putrescine transport system substrate-binding protein